MSTKQLQLVGVESLEGKSAYKYAQDGGYTGTEEEFTEKMSQDYLQKTGDTMVGPLCLTENVHYGAELPTTDLNEGRIFLTQTNILEMVYPVGSIYMSAASVNPTTLFGFGTWEQIQGRFLLAAGSSYAAGATGGEATHTLTVDEMPAHRHSFTYPVSCNPTSDKQINYNWGTETARFQNTLTETKNAGGGAAHNNMPPYLAVYIWKRTA